MRFMQKGITVGLLAAGVLLTGAVQAGTIIFNPGATVAMGVNDDGSLNTTPNIVTNSSVTGLAFKFGLTPLGLPDFRDATSPGCFCEGWGVSVKPGLAPAVSGFANVSTDGGPNNLTIGAPTGVTGSTVTTNTSLTSLPGITVTQTYQPSSNAPDALFRVHVTITNTTGDTVNDVKYVRVMDWDVPPTEFDEFVTIQGVGTTTFLEASHSNGFDTANPLTGGNTGINPACDNTDCVDAGIQDHGAYFRFNFGDLANNATREFDIFYGAAGSEREALAAVSAESIELFSFGQNSLPGGKETGAPATYIFGFAGVGGVPVIPGVPEPASLALLAIGLAGLGALRRRKPMTI